MRRRALLASVGGSLAALAGCIDSLNDTGDLPTEQSPRDGTPSESPTETDAAASVTVSSVVHQWGYVVPSSPDSIGVMKTDTRYVVADVAVEDGPLDRDTFAWTDGESEVRPTVLEEFYRTDWGEDQWYEGGRDRGLLLFELPDDPAADAPRLEWPGGGWDADESLVGQLSAPRPTMNASLSLRDATDGSTERTVEIAVTNESDHEGRYLGALNRVGPMIAYTPVARVTGLVGAGETETLTVADDWMEYTVSEDGDGSASVTYHLDDADGGDTLEIDVSE